MKTTEQLAELYNLPLDWSKLDGTNILVAGASGLIGSALVRALVFNPICNYKVFAMGRSLNRLQNTFLDIISNDKFFLLEGDVLNPLCTDIQFQYIIDCASNANPQMFSLKPVETILGNILGVNNLIKYGITHGLSRFLYVSSGEVYGEGNKESFVETDSEYIDCLNPRSCYPASKRAAENLCIAYGKEYGIDTIIARPCHVYGPGFLKTDDRAYAQFFLAASQNSDIILNSEGLLNRSWCYIVDCVAGLLYILLKGKSLEAYNISDTPMTIREFAYKIAKEAGVQVRIESSDKNSAIISKGILNSTKLRNMGWSPKMSVTENIRSTLEELR